jgi:hypothetical protein
MSNCDDWTLGQWLEFAHRLKPYLSEPEKSTEKEGAPGAHAGTRETARGRAGRGRPVPAEADVEGSDDG